MLVAHGGLEQQAAMKAVSQARDRTTNYGGYLYPSCQSARLEFSLKNNANYQDRTFSVQCLKSKNFSRSLRPGLL